MKRNDFALVALVLIGIAVAFFGFPAPHSARAQNTALPANPAPIVVATMPVYNTHTITIQIEQTADANLAALAASGIALPGRLGRPGKTQQFASTDALLSALLLEYVKQNARSSPGATELGLQQQIESLRQQIVQAQQAVGPVAQAVSEQQ
jgi:hypothetical protein